MLCVQNSFFVSRFTSRFVQSDVRPIGDSCLGPLKKTPDSNPGRIGSEGCKQKSAGALRVGVVTDTTVSNPLQ